MKTMTVVDVCLEEGREISKDATLTIGTYAREAYRSEYGSLPDKELRRKTNGGGSHCFAVYPESFRPTIVKIIEAYYDKRLL